MAKSYDVYGTSWRRGNDKTIILLSEGFSCQSSAEQGMRWFERQGSKHCKVVPTDKQSDDIGMSFEELIS